MEIIAVDFDGTIVEHAFPQIGKPIPFAIETLLKLQKEGYRLVLWTVRTGRLLNEAVQYCRERGLEFYAINCEYPEEKITPDTGRKIAADIYIDDRNLGALPDWGVINSIIKGKTTPTYDMEYAHPKSKGFVEKIRKIFY